MEMMPYRPGLDDVNVPEAGVAAFGATMPVETQDWKLGLPVLENARVTLREVQLEDAPALFAELTTEEVARFISPPPANVEGFEKFIRWTHKQRAEGKHACFVIVPEGQTTAVGMFQVRMLDEATKTAEWGFALGSAFWGSGLFMAGAELALAFAFTLMEVERLEARSATPNGRGNGALRKVGATRETVLEKSFERHGEILDQVLWVIMKEDFDEGLVPAPRNVARLARHHQVH
jgi:RimJ/RimL family protein N-acetyltransferase